MRNNSSEQGYTLVEIMAALLVALLVLGIVFTIRQYSEKTERAIYTQTDIQEQLRQIEQLIVPAIRDSNSISSSVQNGKTVIAIQQTGSSSIVLANITWDPSNHGLIIQKNDPAIRRTFENITQFVFTKTDNVVNVQLESRKDDRSFQYLFSASPRL